MKFLKENKLGFLTFSILVALSLYFYPNLPAEVATKFGFDGKPTQYSSKEFITIFMPAMQLFMIFLIHFMVKASPEKFAMTNSRKPVDIILFATGLLFIGIHLGMVQDPTGKAVFTRYMSWGMALFMIIAGNVFGKTERNFFIGVRVPWTLNSDVNWRATHRLAGKLFVVFGIILFVGNFFFTNMIFMVSAIIIASLVPTIYSYMYFKKYERKEELV